jgi:hypothetical protein
MKAMPFIGLAILLLLATGSAHNELENSYRRGLELRIGPMKIFS